MTYPLLVKIDPKANEYRRYNGRVCTNKVRSDRPLTQAEVEQFRVDPLPMIGEPEKVPA